MSSNVTENNQSSEDKILCRRCGRVLIGETSRQLGFGPTCYKVWKKERSQQIQLFTVEDSTDGEL
jgi:hypothetical protein